MSVDTAHRMMRPRNGSALSVSIYVRSSSDSPARSFKRQEDEAKAVVAAMYDGPVQYHIVVARESDFSPDQQGQTELEALLRTRTIDLVVVDDSTRLGRGTAVHDFFTLANQYETRVVVPRDGIDSWAKPVPTDDESGLSSESQ